MKKEEAPINWFPSATERQAWAKQFSEMQNLKLKAAQAAHAQRMAEEANRLKEMQLKAARKKKSKK